MTSLESAAQQDYLKYIYLLLQETGRATTQMLAERLGVKAPSVTAMIKHLAEDPSGPYVRHTPYQGVELTKRGELVALEMLRHHRLIELFLAEQLEVPWDQVHAEAERLEHVLSEDLEERIAAKLGQPTCDPHGDPIPTRDGAMAETRGIPLNTLPLGASGTVARVPDGEPQLLQYLGSLGLYPGSHVTVESVTTYGDVFTVRVGSEQHVMGGEITRRVLVSPVEGAKGESPNAPGVVP